MLDKYCAIATRKTDVKTKVMAAITTFMTTRSALDSLCSCGTGCYTLCIPGQITDKINPDI